jgi:hypothetical protein
MSENNNNVLPTVYIIRGPFAEGPSEKAYELNRQTGARIYWFGFYFLRPDGNFSYSPNESQKAFEFLLRRVLNYLASGLGKPLIIDGVPVGFGLQLYRLEGSNVTIRMLEDVKGL